MPLTAWQGREWGWHPGEYPRGASFTKAAAYAAELVRSGTRAGGVSFELAPLIGPSHPLGGGADRPIFGSSRGPRRLP
jgi:hypothetical protein